MQYLMEINKPGVAIRMPPARYLFVILLACFINEVQSQDPITRGIAITYTMSSRDHLPEDAAHLREFVDIIAQPYYIQLLGTLNNRSGYMLTNIYTKQTLYCTEGQSGVSFVPEWISIHSCNCYKSQPTNKKDVILGLPVQEYYMVLENDTLHYWSTDAFDMHDPRQNGLRGILLKYHMNDYRGNYEFVATSIDTITLNPERYDPAHHFSPVNFETKEEAFDYCRLHSGTSQILPDTADVSEIFLVMPMVRHRSAVAAQQYQPHTTGEPITPFEGVSVNPDHPAIYSDLTGKPMLLLAIDFEMMDPIPPYILEWIEETGKKFPNVNMAVVSRSPKKQILKAIKQYWELYPVPHFAVDDEYYARFNWRDPLTYVMLNGDHSIAYIRSGYDVHSKAELNRELQKLK